MQIVEPQHHRLQAPELLEKRGDLELQTLLRTSQRLGGKPRGRRIVLPRRHELGVPAGCKAAQNPREIAKLFVVLEAIEGLEHRQVGFGARETL